jgi:hypothetical protein
MIFEPNWIHTSNYLNIVAYMGYVANNCGFWIR